MRRPAPAIGDDETLDQILARQPTETGGRRIKDGVAVRTRYLAAFGTMTLAGGAALSVDLETDFAAQAGTSKRVCHKDRSAESRVVKECVSTCRSRGATIHYKKKSTGSK